MSSTQVIHSNPLFSTTGIRESERWCGFTGDLLQSGFDPRQPHHQFIRR